MRWASADQWTPTPPLPPPPVGPEVALRDSETVHLPVGLLPGLLQHDALTFRAIVLLYLAAWYEAPAGSVPADDTLLASMAGVTPETWTQIKPVVLKGFLPRSDGRLYVLPLVSAAVAEFKRAQAKKHGRAVRARKSRRNIEFNAAMRALRRHTVPGYDPDPVGAIAFSAVGKAGRMAGFVVGDDLLMQQDVGQSPPCPTDEIVALYRLIFPGHPQKTLAARKEIVLRWREDRRRQSLDWWQGYFQHLREHCKPLSRKHFRAELREMVLGGVMKLATQGRAKKTPGR